ncbi:MAG TPA: hypothetical protein VFU62_04100 [Hanamia sp.]|nr:hypothetical protein [Hanamia sp.]
MKKYFSLVIFAAILLFACNENDSSKEKKESYEVTKKELLSKEQKDPTAFISISGHNKKNIVGQTVVRGTLTNKASVAIFKDVEIKLTFYSKTKALLETDKETIFEILEPGESKDFKTKYFAPKGTDSVGLQVLGAKAIF